MIENKKAKHQLVNEIKTDLLTVAEVAEALRVDETTVRRWIKQGALTAITLPHDGKRQSYRVHRRTLEALLSRQDEG
jgi:excisionase family DNA binding protein